MIQIFSAILIFFTIIPSYSQPNDSITPDAGKRITRAVRKIAGDQSKAVFDFTNDGNSIFYIIQGEDKIGYGCIRLVSNYRTGKSSVSDGEKTNSDHEFFMYFVITDSEYRVVHVEVFNYQATKGHEIMSRAWLRQFNGYEEGKSLIFDKDIDGISGATLSARAITADVEKALRMIIQHEFEE